MLHPSITIWKVLARPKLFAAGEPVGMIPDLVPVIRDSDRHPAQYPRRKNKERKHSETPPSNPIQPVTPDTQHHVDDYA